MRQDVIQRLALGSLNAVRSNPSFPFKTGHLKWNATYHEAFLPNQFSIVFDRTIAPYIKYLQNGTKSGGYFTKKGQPTWNRGSTKHVGFEDRAREDVIDYLANEFRSNGRYKVTGVNGRGYGR